MAERPLKRAKPKEEEDDADNGKVPVTVEFKFRSCKTLLVGEGGLVGTLHVPMLQDPTTGRFQIPPRSTQVKGCAKVERRKVCLSRDDKDDKLDGPVEFTAEFERPDATAPIKNLKLGFHLQFYHDDHVHTRLINSSAPMSNEYGKKYYEFQSYSSKPTERASCQGQLNDWERNSGGMLTFYAKGSIDTEPVATECMANAKEFVRSTTWKADYKIKLYTALSAHSPDEGDMPIKMEVGASATADWAQLEKLMEARFPDAGHRWAREAVQNYKYFLDIKIKHKDWNSEKFSPSKAIDEVWHAHLSFSDRYRRDMMAYCGHIIEHSPVLGDQARDQYEAAYKKHVALMKKEYGAFKRDFYNHEFLPKPQKAQEHFREIHDGDSEDCCEFPNMSSCG